MKLGIISDTHDNIGLTRESIDFFEKQEVDAVIHCGDMVAPFTAELFDRDSFDFYAIRGNNDGEWGLQAKVNKFGEFLGEIGELELGDNLLAVYHGMEESIVDSLVMSGEYDYVLRGHTHMKKLHEAEGTIEINPGGIKIPGQDEEFHVATLDLETGEIEFHGVEA